MLAASLRHLRPTCVIGCLKRGLGTRVTRLDQFATIDPNSWNGSNPHTVKNLLAGEWTSTAETESVVDPLNGEVIMAVPKTSVAELAPFCDAMASCSKSGLHNPFKNVSRYVQLGEVSDRIANVGTSELFFEPQHWDAYFPRCCAGHAAARDPRLLHQANHARQVRAQ